MAPMKGDRTPFRSLTGGPGRRRTGSAEAIGQGGPGQASTTNAAGRQLAARQPTPTHLIYIIITLSFKI